MSELCEIDWETYCDLDLTKVGLDRYSAHPSCRVLMGAYALDGGEFKHWEAHKEPIPDELVDALTDGNCFKWAFNAQFERVITRRVLKIPTAVRGWRCTQVLASLMSFAGTLELVAPRIGLPADKQKLSTGKRLIRVFCMPQKVTKAQPHVIRNWETDAMDWEEFCEYNIQDCVAERAVRDRLIKFPIPDAEWKIYELDQIVNDRGKPVDVRFVRNAIAMSARRKAELTSAMRDLTGLANPGSPVQLQAWLIERGYPFRDLRKDTVSKVLTENGNLTEAAKYLTEDAVKALKLRQWQARLSIKKFDAILERVGADGRCRYLLQMAGAARTGRWAGRGPQPQNLASTPAFLEELAVLTAVTQFIRDGDYDALELFDSEPMASLVGCVRSSFRAEEGYEFVVADLASIESAVVAWLTNCIRLLQVFRDGRDPYKDFATEFYQIAYDLVTKAQRKFSKPPTLGCAYRLGGGELREGKRTGLWGYAENMGQDITRDESHKAVKVFRATYPEIEQHWKKYEAAIERTMKTRLPTVVGKLTFLYMKPFLLMRLPSGRHVFYYQPRMKMRTISTGRKVQVRAPKTMDPQECYFMHGCQPGELYEAPETYKKLAFTYMGQDQKTRAWVRRDGHGGTTIEQATQATARDVLAYGGLLRSHKRRFNLCSHVHDEAVTLRKRGDIRYGLAELIECMRKPLPWADGLPLNAAGYVGDFYRKD